MIRSTPRIRKITVNKNVWSRQRWQRWGRRYSVKNYDDDVGRYTNETAACGSDDADADDWRRNGPRPTGPWLDVRRVVIATSSRGAAHFLTTICTATTAVATPQPQQWRTKDTFYLCLHSRRRHAAGLSTVDRNI